jgi:hypothetical protein
VLIDEPGAAARAREGVVKVQGDVECNECGYRSIGDGCGQSVASSLR